MNPNVYNLYHAVYLIIYLLPFMQNCTLPCTMHTLVPLCTYIFNKLQNIPSPESIL